MDNRRVWIGNLDSRLTEFNVLKMLQKYGELEKFDFLYHKKGLCKGQPRGFCFATYTRRIDAEKAIHMLTGKVVLSKTLRVQWAEFCEDADSSTNDERKYGTSSSVSRGRETSATDSADINRTITAIEKKLKEMEEDDKIRNETSNKMADVRSNRCKPYKKKKNS